MRINTVSSPNFGALQIDRGAISGLSEYECKKLYKAGEELKDTEVFHLEIQEGGHPVVTDGHLANYWTPMDVEKPDGEFFIFKEARPQLGFQKPVFRHYYRLANAQKAAEAYEKMISCVSNLDKSVQLTKILEESAQLKKTEAFKRQASEMHLQHLKQDLYKKYGTDI